MLIAVGLGALGGALAGWGSRRILRRLRRGVAIRPPTLEVAGAVIAGLGVGLRWPSPLVGLVVWAGVLAVALSAVDIAAHRLPDALTLPAMPATALIVLATWLAAPGSGRPLVAAVAAVLVTGAFWLVARLVPVAMGMGDVKLVPSLALMTGYLSAGATLWWLMLAFLIGAVVSLVGLAARRLSVRSAIPFGPCLLAGCWLVLAIPGPAQI